MLQAHAEGTRAALNKCQNCTICLSVISTCVTTVT